MDKLACHYCGNDDPTCTEEYGLLICETCQKDMESEIKPISLPIGESLDGDST